MVLNFLVMKMKTLSKKFYFRAPDIVARKLLGKLLVRKIGKTVLIGRIVETEAYFDENDPASRASMSGKWLEKMLREPGRSFIYMVHNNWLLNVIAHENNKAGAVLIRALEPVKGIEVMKKFRKRENVIELTNGPGKLTEAMKIDKTLDNIKVYDKRSKLVIVSSDKDEHFDIARAFRIGVRRDLPKPMRFFIKENRFVSKK